MKIHSFAPTFSRCLTFQTSAGSVMVKVMGPDSTTPGVRDALVAALESAGLKHVPAIAAALPAPGARVAKASRTVRSVRPRKAAAR